MRFKEFESPGLHHLHLSFTQQQKTPSDSDISIKMVTMMNFEPSAAAQESYILCADCGTVINSTNGANLCRFPAAT
jgi:nonsense-mediated mRNA decay protein 3